MHASDGKLTFAATDISNFLACPQLSLLSRHTALGGPKPPKFDDPGVEVLWQRGLEHEQAYLSALTAEPGVVVTEVLDPDPGSSDRWSVRSAKTVEAMEAGSDWIYQGALFDGTWVGLPDFLKKVDRSSQFGPWSYEVVDTKLAREAKGGAVLQISFYSELLELMQDAAPEYMHLALGGPQARTESFRVADFAAYYRSVKRRFRELMSSPTGPPAPCPEPVEHCRICAWSIKCDRERHEADHLSLVAGISRKQRQSLGDRNVFTMDALAEFPLPIEPPLEGVSRVAATKIREQARVQVEGRTSGKPVYELFEPPVEGEGLASLPEPSPGDLFFDIEGDPYAFAEGIEYLLGFVDTGEQYTGLWGLDRAEEKTRFQEFIDLLMARLDEDPNLHIYHYAAYEPTALKRLMGRHATREEEVDKLLRGNVFVDLYRVVRQGLRASVESYSIKKLETFYGFDREVDLRAASNALAHFEAWLELGAKDEGGTELLDEIEGYNRDDCISTVRLRDWLETLRTELEEASGQSVPRPEAPDLDPGEDLTDEQERVATLAAALTSDVPAETEERSLHQARWLLAQLLSWHRREKKSMWWEFFHWLSLSDEELLEDRSTLGGLTYDRVVGTVKRSNIHRYRYPRQEHAINIGGRPVDPATEDYAGTVVELHDALPAIDLKRGMNSTAPHPAALVPLEDVRDGVLRQSLFRLGEAAVTHGLGDGNPYRAANDLLFGALPRAGQSEGQPLQQEGETTLEAACRLVHSLEGSVLPIQGPPGSGKTYTGARMILSLLRAGKRVGVTATSHQVISHLLAETCRAAQDAGYPIRGVQKAKEGQACGFDEIAAVGNYAEVGEALNGDVQLLAGTAWLWSREEMAQTIDVLFIDEAGQFSLANALAVSPAADSMVLLGDPQQLEQPQRGVHPPGADVSALDHLLSGEPTMPSDKGLFLAETWRLHPQLCSFTSEVFYRGRLRSRPTLSRQRVVGPEPVNGSGLRLIAVDHTGNQNESMAEVIEVTRLVDRVLDSGATWIDKDGEEHTITRDDLLIVAPYNAQVSALAASLPDDARVGTVDKFQGQQAPIVLYSMATSSPEDAPRGMRFLFSGNRLNVATSRARCLVIVVANPKLFGPECKSPEQMKLANAFCRYRELVTAEREV